MSHVLRIAAHVPIYIDPVVAPKMECIFEENLFPVTDSTTLTTALHSEVGELWEAASRRCERNGTGVHLEDAHRRCEYILQIFGGRL